MGRMRCDSPVTANSEQETLKSSGPFVLCGKKYGIVCCRALFTKIGAQEEHASRNVVKSGGRIIGNRQLGSMQVSQHGGQGFQTRRQPIFFLSFLRLLLNTDAQFDHTSQCSSGCLKGVVEHARSAYSVRERTINFRGVKLLMCSALNKSPNDVILGIRAWFER
ncbi:hypothetical protein N658DRAFT_560548 [Parathielavia hyrcaniae]|uniref:Uncharacterized protein n=1 Tax=Parathielavia hyrcaniae TaxID=113614 RepID=A0AAN6Q1H4_9PEZI|nr:hypothetical protein N658DRAFT_560548 [Parathielavia hyrcaniae]